MRGILSAVGQWAIDALSSTLAKWRAGAPMPSLSPAMLRRLAPYEPHFSRRA